MVVKELENPEIEEEEAAIYRMENVNYVERCPPGPGRCVGAHTAQFEAEREDCKCIEWSVEKKARVKALNIKKKNLKKQFKKEEITECKNKQKREKITYDRRNLCPGLKGDRLKARRAYD